MRLIAAGLHGCVAVLFLHAAITGDTVSDVVTCVLAAAAVAFAGVVTLRISNHEGK